MNVIQCLKGSEDDYKLVTSVCDSDESKEPDVCLICLEPVSDVPFYILYSEDVDIHIHIHKSCGELPGKINHPLHAQHPLKIYNFAEKKNIRFSDFTCDVCFTLYPGFKYGCKICEKNICYPCISKYDVEGSQELKQRVQISTSYHPHKLQLLNLPDLRDSCLRDGYLKCYCCLKDIRDFGYVCLRCYDFWSHESCISDIPEPIVESSFHPGHFLTLKYLRPKSTLRCKGCRQEIKQVLLGCSICNCSFHVSCGQYTSRGLRVNGNVTLFYINDYFDDVDYWCGICDEKIFQAPMYRYLESFKNFHVECLVPPMLNHPCHLHQLTLTSSVERKTEAKKYCCDFCEKEEDFEHYVYQCKECDYNAHVECLLTQGEESLAGELLQLFSNIKYFSIKDEAEDSGENEDGEEIFNSWKLKEKIINLTDYIKRLRKERDIFTKELNLAKLVYEKKSKE